MKDSELKTDRHNRPTQKSELDINRLYLPIQSEDRIGIGRSINLTFRPPLLIQHTINSHKKNQFLKNLKRNDETQEA
jgi:hypothetical protein